MLESPVSRLIITGTNWPKVSGPLKLSAAHGRQILCSDRKQLTSQLLDRYFRLTEEEARAAWGDEYPQFWDAEENGGGFTVGLDVFHTLHCLDHIRQRFYPDYYPQTSIHGLKHHEHCINHLRQMVQCYSDATPIPTRFFPGIGHNYVDSNRLHTCRDFGAIRKWTSERFESDGLHDFDDHNGA